MSSVDLQAYGRAEPAAHELALERLEQVLVAVLLHLEVGVAGDPEQVVLDDLHAGEQHRRWRRSGPPAAGTRPRPRLWETTTNRGTLLGTFTRAKWRRRPSGSRTRTARFSDNPEM